MDGRKRDADVTALVRRLEATGIPDLYGHAGPLNHAHFDLEPLHSGDDDYLTLLDALREETRAREVPPSDIGHHESAETVSAAVRGTRLGLPRTDPDRKRFGVALYVDFAAKEEDWTAYQEDWVR